MGRKRVALVDAAGHWLAVAVVSASVQDRDALPALDAGNLHGMRHRLAERDPAAEGFVVIPRRWVVERSFGWLSHWGGLVRDRAGRLDVAAARMALAAILSGVEALLNPMPVRHAGS